MADRCGISCWHPKWMRRFENTRSFLIIYGILGIIQAAAYMYFVVTLSTMEKRFKIPSQTTGILLSGNEISQILLSLTLTYYGGQSNRPRFIAWGVVFAGLSCFILALPHFIYGAGDDAIQLTKEYLSDHQNVSSLFSKEVPKKNSKLCQSFVAKVDGSEEVLSYLPQILIFLSQFVLGIGNTLYYTLGQTYIDDNTHHRRTPLILAYTLASRMSGPILGFGLAYVIMNIYIDPMLTPIILKDDPRWLGAWWLGWILLGTLMMIFAALLGMFPKGLQAQQKKVENDSESMTAMKNRTEPKRVMEDDSNNFSKALMRLIKNKLLMFNNIATIFYILSHVGMMTYMSRVMEVQFNRSSAGGSIFTGPIMMLGMVFGLLISGIVITKYQPAPKYLFFWNIIVVLISMFARLSYSQLGCPSENSLLVNGTVAPISCNSNCFCDEISYTPVCDKMTGETFFSPCHAGCKRFDEKGNVYADCVCSTFSKSTMTAMTATNDTMPSNWPNKHAWNDAELVLNRDAYDHHGIISEKDSNEYDDSEENALDNSEERLLSKSDGEDQESENRSEMSRKRRDASVERPIIPGACTGDCDFAYYTFSFISMGSAAIGITGRLGSILLSFRAVEARDKSFSQGLLLFLTSLLALIPGPIIFGRLIDSTCLIWSQKGGDRGDCQLYDPELFREYFHLVSAAFAFLAAVFDVLVWHLGKNLNLYDDPKETYIENSHEIEPLNK